MGLREKLNENPAITTGATIAVIVIALIFIVYSVVPAGVPKGMSQAFFTVDDGANYFVDDVKKRAPFDKDGKTAVRAHVYECGGKKFVAYMERYRPEAKTRVEAMDAIMAKGKAATPQELTKMQMMMPEIMETGVEYKKPGAQKWFRTMDDYQRLTPMLQVTCPDKSQVAEPVYP